MEIKELRDCPEFKDTVVEWINREFGDENTIQFYRSIIEHSMVKDKLPLTFVAVDNGKLLGTAGIWRGDLLSRQDLYPWFSALVVNPEYRNGGIGIKIQNHILEYCKAKGFKEIYLYTDLVGYYEKNDWSKFDTGYEYTTGEGISIYMHNL